MSGGVRGLVYGHRSVRTTQNLHPVPDHVIQRTRRRILRWGRRNFLSYPWRSEEDPWLSFIAEFLLQRTRASQVVPVFSEIRRRFPTVAAFASSDVTTLESITASLGLHARARLLLEIAKKIASNNGILPTNIRDLCQLKGVGLYTATAWLSLHCDMRAPILDSNICRWLSRMTGLPYNRDPRHIHWVQTLADDLTPARVFRDYNYAILDFTMTICKQRHPLCQQCPMQDDCRYYSELCSDPAETRPTTPDCATIAP